MDKNAIDKLQYGDSQTPIDLAIKIVKVLKRNHSIDPDIIIEPTCGKGAFIQAALEEFKRSRILGFDINKEYVDTANLLVKTGSDIDRLLIKEADFFEIHWKKILSEQPGYLLIIGNPPWVTSSALGMLNSNNLPKKSNFQHRRGIEAITGYGNFDISEWMLLQHVAWLSNREGAIALLCKYAVARKVMRQVKNSPQPRFCYHIYRIDAKTHFGASVDACLFVLTTEGGHADCEVYDHLNATLPSLIIGERDGFIVRNVVLYEKWQHLRGQETRYIWRSGVKHDCSKVMELEPVKNGFKNGLGETVILESDYIFPLLKSSDVGNKCVNAYRKVVLITQKAVGDETSTIKDIAPKTWQYLLAHRDLLDKRRSTIYRNKPAFSIFGIGSYTFKNWKIAISGFYKKLNFNLVGPLDGKTVVFDDTVNFLSFDTESEARFIYCLITSLPSFEFLDSMIFWDEKRPITTDILRRLSLREVAKELGVFDQYQGWATTRSSTLTGQLELGIAERESQYNQA
jgi:hypothetical protein